MTEIDPKNEQVALGDYVLEKKTDKCMHLHYKGEKVFSFLEWSASSGGLQEVLVLKDAPAIIFQDKNGGMHYIYSGEQVAKLMQAKEIITSIQNFKE